MARCAILQDEIDLDKQKKHTIEIVVDRLVLGGDLRNRLTDSVETALEAAEGLVVIDEGGKRDLLFSRHLACPECGISVPELAPRMFSFNSPYGACQECGGLGHRKVFDIGRILLDENLSLRDGAIAWGDANWFQVVESSLFRAFKIPPTTPYKKLPPAFKKLLWEGSGDREFDFRWKGTRTAYSWRRTWSGILPSSSASTGRRTPSGGARSWRSG
jgi:excinuclease ABC subunit A